MRVLASCFFFCCFLSCMENTSPHLRNENSNKILIEETVQFYLSRLPRKMIKKDKELFILDSYFQAIGKFSVTNGECEDIFSFKDFDLSKMYNLYSPNDSLVLPYDSIYNEQLFTRGFKMEAFQIKNNDLYMLVSLSIPHKSSRQGEGNYRYWYREFFIVRTALDKPKSSIQYYYISEAGDEVSSINGLSSFYVSDSILIMPVSQLTEKSSIFTYVLDKNNTYHKYKEITMDSDSALDIGKSIYFSEIIDCQDFFVINVSKEKFYNLSLYDLNDNKFKPYRIKNNDVYLSVYFPNSVGGIYSVLNGKGDTLYTMDWTEASVPCIDNENNRIYYVTQENDSFFIRYSTFE